MTTTADTNRAAIADVLATWAEHFDAALDQMLEPGPDVPARLAEAARYAAQGGGKRIRPFIVTRVCELCGGTAEIAAPAAVAIECVHAFSLVHDDLPAMDDDDLRRGRPTCHKAFGEAVAILAGDALLALAFEVPATRIKDPSVARAVMAELANATGWAGMIGGQAVDILSETQPTQLSLVQRIHRYKTARLIECSARMGALCAGADRATVDRVGEFGLQLGLAFQIADDLLDVTGSSTELGKAVAKDADAGKQTYPAAAGIDASREAAEQAVARAVNALDVFGPAADDLRQLARFVIERRK